MANSWVGQKVALTVRLLVVLMEPQMGTVKESLWAVLTVIPKDCQWDHSWGDTMVSPSAPNLAAQSVNLTAAQLVVMMAAWKVSMMVDQMETAMAERTAQRWVLRKEVLKEHQKGSMMDLQTVL